MTYTHMLETSTAAIWYFWPVPLIAAAEMSVGSFPFGSLTSTGILCWYVWHVNSKALPRINEQHNEEKHEMREGYTKIINTQIEANKESSKTMASALDNLTEAIKKSEESNR